eukprot:5405204-Amphidinium_carterae.1
MADIGFDFCDEREEPSSSDLEEAMFGTRDTRTASVFGGPRIDSNGSVFTVDRETEVRVPCSTKDREVTMEHT